MRVIEIEGSGWRTISDFLAALHAAIGAPPGHGNSPDAFVDSMVWGGMNSVDQPYEIRVMGGNALSHEIWEYATLIAAALMDARADHRLRTGHDVDVSLTVFPHSSN